MSFFHNRKITRVDEFCPILGLYPDERTTITKGGKYARVIELTGKDYSGLGPVVLESLFLVRKGFIEGLPGDITVLQHSHRQIIRRGIETGRYGIPIAQKISETWSSRFRQSFRTRHFLIFVTDPDIKDQLQLIVQERDRDESRTDELLRQLEDVVKDVRVRLNEYGPRELGGDDLSSYWAWLLNGRNVFQRTPADGLLDGLLSGTSLQWPLRKRYQVYDGTMKRYSSWLYIKAPANTSNHGLLDALFKCRREFSIYQTLSNFDKQEALSFLEDKRKNISNFAKSPEIIIAEILENQQRVQSDNISMVSHRWAVEIFEDSIEALEKAVITVKNVIENYGYRAAQERVNQEALFWAKFPEFQKFNCRQRFLTSENTAHFMTFATVGEGHESCTWGNVPVSIFKTESGSEFSFIFHISPEKAALGNTLVIGGTGTGKTTLISFLLSQCFKYPEFKVLAFDRLKGMNIFTKFHDGIYEDFRKGLEINPLQLDDTSENRAFLNQWFQILTGKTDEDSVEKIGQAVIQAFELEKKNRTLENIKEAFGLPEKGSVRKALNNWLSGGIFDGFFTGKKDALDFSNPLVVYDMTALLDVPDILGPMAYYLFHKLFLTARNKGGYAVFVDELGKYLKSELFVPKIEMMLEEIRKTNGVFIGAVQEPGTVLNHPIATKIKSNIGTYVLFPDPRAEKEYYMDNLRLNETEFQWIKRAHLREVMIKRKDGESVIINVDLSPLRDYLKIFDSSAESILEMETLKQKEKDWKKKFLGFRKSLDEFAFERKKS